eukprot:2212543-Rhodomonas_salina.1
MAAATGRGVQFDLAAGAGSLQTLRTKFTQACTPHTLAQYPLCLAHLRPQHPALPCADAI